MSRSLLDQIEQGALDSNQKLADVLRQCIALGGKANSKELRECASRELRGYSGDDELPEYRAVPAAIMADAVTGTTHVTGQRISPRALPDFVQKNVSEQLELRHSIGEIEDIATRHVAKNESVKFSLPMGADIANVMDQQVGDPFQKILALYWQVGPSSLVAIIDQVRTTLVELVAELRAAMPRNETIPSPEVAKNAVEVVLHGGERHQVTVTAAQGRDSSATSTTSTPSEQSSWWTPWRKVGAAVVGVATVAGTVIALLQLVGD